MTKRTRQERRGVMRTLGTTAQSAKRCRESGRATGGGKLTTEAPDEPVNLSSKKAAPSVVHSDQASTETHARSSRAHKIKVQTYQAG